MQFENPWDRLNGQLIIFILSLCFAKTNTSFLHMDDSRLRYFLGYSGSLYIIVNNKTNFRKKCEHQLNVTSSQVTQTYPPARMAALEVALL